MSGPLTLKVTAEPTIFNKEALIGFFTPLAFIGAIIGGFIGKNRMEEEKSAGKIVTDKPSFWNKDTLLGGLIGGWVGALVAFVARGVIAGPAIAELAATGVVTGANAPLLVTALAVSAVISLGSITLGAYLGGKSGQAHQVQEYEAAKQQTIVGHISKTVSHEVGKAVEYSMEHNKDWGKHVSEERLLAEAQQGQTR